MKRGSAIIAVVAALCFVCPVFAKEKAQEPSGEALFKQHCSPCHPDGGNVISVSKTLHAKDREVHHIKTAEDIVRLMRNPGPGMIKFGKEVIPEKDARAIAEYIMKTFQ